MIWMGAVLVSEVQMCWPITSFQPKVCGAKFSSTTATGRIALAILLIEETALQQRDAHDLQVIGRYGGGERHRLLAGRKRIGGGPIWPDIYALTHRNDVASATKSTSGTRRMRSMTSCQADRIWDGLSSVSVDRCQNFEA